MILKTTQKHTDMCILCQIQVCFKTCKSAFGWLFLQCFYYYVLLWCRNQIDDKEVFMTSVSQPRRVRTPGPLKTQIQLCIQLLSVT